MDFLNINVQMNFGPSKIVQIKTPKNEEPPKPNHTKKINDPILIKILTYLNVVLKSFDSNLCKKQLEICAITRVCRRWQNLIEKDYKMFESVNLEIIPQHIQILNLLKIFSRDKHMRQLKLPIHASQSDTSYLIMCLPNTLAELQINNIDIECSKVFTRKFEHLKSLTLNNYSKRKKDFDEIELKAIVVMATSIQELILNNTPVEDSTISQLLIRFKHLGIIIYNKYFKPNSQQLMLLRLGINVYIVQQNILLIQHIQHWEEPLRNITQNCRRKGSNIQLLQVMEFVAKIGDEVLKILAKNYCKTLKSIEIIRNCYEKCAKISDFGLKCLSDCSELKNLTVVYSRKFKQEAHLFISSFHKLQFICFKDCPLQCDLSILSTNCPQLEEVDISGDSWVCKDALIGLSKHPNLRQNIQKQVQANRKLHLGHFEHGDQICDNQLQNYPPEGMFIESLFKQSTTFVRLSILYLQANCNLTYWLDFRLAKIRPSLFIKYIQDDTLIQQK